MFEFVIPDSSSCVCYVLYAPLLLIYNYLNVIHIASGSSLPPPVLTIFPLSSTELQSYKVSLVCLSSQSVPFADVTWLAAGSPVSSGISISTAAQQLDQTFQISSYWKSRHQTGTWIRFTHVKCLWVPSLQRKTLTSQTVPLNNSGGAEPPFNICFFTVCAVCSSFTC
ncbi:Immunoglobulin lambda constant 6 [Channa argus]|nr:Immunoglobulin lambda constant 6 [Channa argus]